MSATVTNSQGTGPRYAAPGDILDALEALPEEEVGRLLRFADLCARLRGLPDGGRELMSETLHRTLNREGDDRWDMSVEDFRAFMRRAVETAAKGLENRLYVDRKDRGKGMRYASGTGDGPGSPDLLDQCPSPAVDDWRAYDAKEAVARIFALFDGDEPARAVIRCWFDGLTRAEIMEAMGVSVKGYEAIERRIDRRVKRAGLTFTPEVDTWRRNDRGTSRNFQTS